MTCHAPQGGNRYIWMRNFLSLALDSCHFCFPTRLFFKKKCCYWKVFLLNWQKHFKLKYETFLFTASYTAIHKSTRNCTFLVMGSPFILQWHTPDVQWWWLIGAHYSHTGILTLRAFSWWKPIAVEALQYKEGSKVSCYFLNLGVNELCALIK